MSIVWTCIENSCPPSPCTLWSLDTLKLSCPHVPSPTFDLMTLLWSPQCNMFTLVVLLHQLSVLFAVFSSLRGDPDSAGLSKLAPKRLRQQKQHGNFPPRLWKPSITIQSRADNLQLIKPNGRSDQWVVEAELKWRALFSSLRLEGDGIC